MKSFNSLKTLNLITLTAALGCLCLASGCGKKEESTPPEPIPGVSKETQATMTTLTTAARKYATEKRQIPMNLDEVVAAGYLKSVPAPPAGKKWALDPRRVVVLLVDE
jgi:hypothetical protein